MAYINKIFSILNNKQKKILIVISLISMVLMLLEIIGLSLVYPLVSVVIDPIKFKDLLSKYDELHFLSELESKSLIFYIIALIGLFYLIKILIQILGNYLKTKLSNNLAANIGDMMYNGYLRQPLSFSTEKNSAYIIRNIIELPNQYTNNALVNLLLISFEIFFILLAFSLFIAVNKVIGLVTLSLSILFVFLFIFINKKGIVQYGKSINQRIAERLKITKETIEGLKDINLFKKQSFFKRIFDTHNYKIASLLTGLEIRVIFPKYLMEFFGVTFLLSSIIFLLVNDYDINEIIPTLALIGAGMARIIPSVSRILSFYTRIQAAKFTVDTIFFEKKKFDNIIKNKNIIFKFEKEIIFNNVSFQYNDKNIIKDLSFSIKKNSIFGIKGKSGSGKTTILNLISGFLEPNKGDIIVDDKRIVNNVENWQNLISYVPQKTFFIDDTIKSNICLGLEEREINYEHLKNAIKLSKAEGFINKLDNGIEQRVGEGGKNLSYGQSQRIALARSLYKKPKLLMLDETTSGLDLETEKLIIDELTELKKYLTIILVSHRTETLKYCDKILNVEDI
tara:strand:- start:1598 stop:3292 length:1695 start_codon:yes stop_codon:yes gene_type:complete